MISLDLRASLLIDIRNAYERQQNKITFARRLLFETQVGLLCVLIRDG